MDWPGIQSHCELEYLGNYYCKYVAQQSASKGGAGNSLATSEKSLNLYERILLKKCL